MVILSSNMKIMDDPLLKLTKKLVISIPSKKHSNVFIPSKCYNSVPTLSSKHKSVYIPSRKQTSVHIPFKDHIGILISSMKQKRLKSHV